MSDPVIKLEIESFGGVWANYADRLRLAKTKRGRRRAIDKVNAGTMVVSLANEDRELDPEHPGTLVFPGQRIRISADYNANNWPIWAGRVDRIVQAYDPPNKSTAILECSDGLATLERTRMESTYEVSQKPISKRVWLRFGEGLGATIANDSSGNARHSSYVGSPTLEASPLMLFDSDTAVEFIGGTGGQYALLQPGTLPVTLPFSINFLMNMTASGAFVPIIFSTRWPNGLTIWMDAAGKINVRQMENGAIVAYSRTTPAFSGNTFQISIQFVAGAPIRIYDHTGTDWTDYASDIGLCAPEAVADYYVFGHTTGGTFDEFFVTDYAFTPAEMAAINFGGSGWFPEGFTSRIARVLEAVGWPVGDTVYMIDDELTYPIPATLEGVSALDHLRELIATMEAQMFIQADGKLRFLGRYQRAEWGYATSRAIFGDAPGELGYIGLDGYALDTELVTNIVRREAHNQITTAVDLDSIAKYGTRDQATQISYVRSLFLDASLDYDLAKYRLAHYREAIPTVDGLVLSPRKDPDNLWIQVLEREISDTITLRRRPQNVGAAIEKDMIIEGVEHTIAPKSWKTVWHIDAINSLRFFTFDHTEWDDPDWRFIA